MKYIVILASSLMIYSGLANAQSERIQTRGAGQAVESPLFGGLLNASASHQEQPCHLPASKRYSHKHVYDEDAYLRRISYQH